MPKSVQMFLALAGITLVSGLALGGLNTATREIAANNVLRFKKVPAVLTIAEGFGPIADRGVYEEQLLKDKRSVDLGGDAPALVFVVREDGKVRAVALEDFGSGFGGDVGVMVGVDVAAGEIAGIGVTTMSETPGVGTRAADPAYTGQFKGLPLTAGFKLKKDGGAIDAVSGATITSRAVATAVEAAVGAYTKNEAAIKAAASSAGAQP